VGQGARVRDDVDAVAIPSVLLQPLPFRVREYPERSASDRATLVRSIVVGCAAEYAPILAALRAMNRAPLLLDAMNEYTRAADHAARVLGLPHRRDLRAADDGPLPLRHDRGDIIALAQLEPGTLERWAVATAILSVVLERAPGAVELRQALTAIPALVPLRDWLGPALHRWAHLRLYEVLFGPFDVGQGPVARVPEELEALAVLQDAVPLPRPLFERRPRNDRAHTLAYQAKAWWAIKIVGQPYRDVARRWHEALQPDPHVQAHALESPEGRGRRAGRGHADDCACRRIVRDGVKEVDALLRAAV
jgi:hypothetical protein